MGKTSSASAPARAVSAAIWRACWVNEAASPATTSARPPTSSTTISSSRRRSSGNRWGPSPVSTFTARPRTPWGTSQLTYLRSDSSSTDRSLRIGVTIAAIKPFRSGWSMRSSFVAVAWHIAPRIRDGRPHPLWGHRRIDVADTKVGKRIDHRVVDRGPGADCAPLTDALCPERVAVSGSYQRDGVECGQLRRARHRVCGKAGSQGVALLVIDERLIQRLGSALGSPSVDLSLDQHRVDAAPAIVGCNVTDQLHLPGLGVDLHHRDVYTGRICRIRHLEIVLRPQPGFHAGRKR